MSAAAKLPRLVPVSTQEHAREGLLPGWEFLRAPQGAGLECSLCGRPAAYVVASSGFGRCAKHAKDF